MVYLKNEKEVLKAVKRLKMLLMDVDGVMTDGKIIFDNQGREIKIFHVRDGYGIKLLIEKGINVGIISARESNALIKRVKELGIDINNVYQRCYDKFKAYEDIKNKYRLNDKEIGYIGDDVVDIPILRKVGFSVVVADSVKEAQEIAMMITKNKGGKGAVREVAEFILRVKGLWQEIIDAYMEA